MSSQIKSATSKLFQSPVLISGKKWCAVEPETAEGMRAKPLLVNDKALDMKSRAWDLKTGGLRQAHGIFLV